MNEGRWLTVCGVLFCVLAVSNFLKPLELHASHGFVLLGERLRGTPNLLVAPLAGVFLAVYGWAVLRRHALALPMSRIYAAWVIANLVLFTVRMPEEALGKPVFGLVYATVAIGVSSGCAWLLGRRRPALG
jgi:hypothetical protein